MIKRKKKNSIHFWVYVFSFLVILSIVILYLNWFFSSNISDSVKNVVDTTQNTFSGVKIEIWSKQISWTDKLYANSSIWGEWEIVKIPYDIKNGTSFKIKYDWKFLFAKSDEYDLNNYLSGKVSFSGDVIAFAKDNTPVINITKIDKIIDEEEQKNNHKNFEYKWLILKLDNTDYQVKNKNWDLIIYTTWDNKNIIKISPFKCKKWSSLYDCEKLKQVAKTYAYPKIVSDNWLVFYSLPEVKQYYFLWNEYGYNIFPLSWDLLDVVNLIDLKKDIASNISKEKLEKIILSTCKNQNVELSKILQISKNNEKYEVEGLDKYSNKVICKLEIKNWQPIIASLDKVQIQNNKTETLSWNIIEDKKIDESKYLKYTSRWNGFTLYMPKSIKYKSELIDNDFWVSWLKCVQQVNIENYKTAKNKDYSNLDPDVKVIYCKTKLDIDTISGLLKTKLKYRVLDVNGKKFIILFKNTDIAKKIKNSLIIY